MTKWRPWRKPRETSMDDEATGNETLTVDDAQRLPEVADHTPAPEIDDAQTEQWAREGIPPIEPVGHMPFRGRMAVAPRPAPEPMISPVRIDCEHCGGVGYVPGLNDYLLESAGLLGDNPDEVVRLFYSTLLSDAPALAALFPADIVTASVGTAHSAGVAQREKLLAALVALAELYDPGVPGKMDRLNAALARFGRSHAAFARQDGTVWGATLEEYAAVKSALFSTLVRVLGEKWKPEYTSAWSQAYDYAAAVMLAEQFRSGFTAPRFARP